jgi:hypothetical protein
MSEHFEMAIVVLTAIVCAAFLVWLLWGAFWDAYDNITGRWKRINNARSDFAQHGQFADRAQRGSKTRGHV